jgi:hypothetical protein
MTTLDQALQTAVASIPDCIAGAYVDLETGMLLGIRTITSQPEAAMEMLAAATTDLFQGPSVTMIEGVFRDARGQKDTGRHYFQEIIVNSDNMIHVFLRGRAQKQGAAFVCRKNANLGMALVKARLAMGALEGAL